MLLIAWFVFPPNRFERPGYEALSGTPDRLTSL
jgi:hypothetical protein